jgi:LPS export ABC transporter protein LptC
MTLRQGALAAAALLLASCSFDYGSDKGLTAEQIPVMSFRGLKQTGIKDGHKQYVMQSEAADIYSVKKQTLLKNFQFEEYDSQGAVASNGHADEAVINTATNDAEINGKLRAYDSSQGVTLETGAGGLTWANDDRVLKTKEGTPVTLTKPDGSDVEGQGLVLDLGANRLELQEGIQGTWNPENKDDATTPTPSPAPSPSPTPHP